MEKLNFVRNGVVRLPPGFRFHPTDEELVVQYLKRKVFSCPLPASIIPELDVCKFDPWDLPGEFEQERYFFVIKESKYAKGGRANRATGSGYWKATGSDKQIVATRSNQVVGMKKTLVFYRGKPPKGSKTDWIMHEYRLSDSATRACIFPHRKNSTQSSIGPMEDWVLCRVSQKKRSNKDDMEILEPCNASRVKDHGTVLIDFMGQSNTESGSELSGVTQLSSVGSPNEEISSSCNTISSASSGRED